MLAYDETHETGEAFWDSSPELLPLLRWAKANTVFEKHLSLGIARGVICYGVLSLPLRFMYEVGTVSRCFRSTLSEPSCSKK